ncbi:uncharacterized protein LOC142564178 [Dermacentor variabilis]|uniref:uncharacterized protein LOC142564178 n=1 Tax=Dermacentor variabilis TaxID=34621 RepID=UPI003F5AFD01
MLKHFSRYSKLLRTVGCFFICNFEDKLLDEARIAWRGIYTLYSAAWITLMLFFEVTTLYGRFRQLDFNATFTDTVLVTVHLCVILKSTINFSCIVFGSFRLLEFFRQAALFERSAGVSYQALKYLPRKSWPRIFIKLMIVISSVITFGGAVTRAIEIFLESVQHNWTYVLIVPRILSQLAFIIYETSMYIFLSIASEVLVSYTMFQGWAFLKCQNYTHLASSDEQVMSIEVVRRNLYKIRKLKKHVNAVWAPAILSFSLTSLWVVCTTLYCLFSGHENPLDLWLGLAYGASCALRLLDLAIISDDLCSEAQDIRRMTKTARIIHVADAHVSQIQYLHDSIDPPSMRLTGASFFCVGRRLLVAMAGSVITYTVILVQTSDGLSSGMNRSGKNATS